MNTKTFIVAQWLTTFSLAVVHEVCLSCGITPSVRPGYGCYIQSYSALGNREFNEIGSNLAVYITGAYLHPNGSLGLIIESRGLRERTTQRDLSAVFKDLEDEILVTSQASVASVARLENRLRKKPILVTLTDEVILETVEQNGKH